MKATITWGGRSYEVDTIEWEDERTLVVKTLCGQELRAFNVYPASVSFGELEMTQEPVDEDGMTRLVAPRSFRID